MQVSTLVGLLCDGQDTQEKILALDLLCLHFHQLI
jgi:hypothetical protein